MPPDFESYKIMRRVYIILYIVFTFYIIILNEIKSKKPNINYIYNIKNNSQNCTFLYQTQIILNKICTIKIDTI